LAASGELAIALQDGFSGFAIVVTIRISIEDLIAGVEAATNTFYRGGKHPRAATCTFRHAGCLLPIDSSTLFFITAGSRIRRYETVCHTRTSWVGSKTSAAALSRGA